MMSAFRAPTENGSRLSFQDFARPPTLSTGAGALEHTHERVARLAEMYRLIDWTPRQKYIVLPDFEKTFVVLNNFIPHSCLDLVLK